MVIKKKRLRYKTNAAKIAKQHNIQINLDSWEEIWDLLDKYKEPDYVYVIGEANGDRVKIGHSINPGQRLKGLQTSHPEKLYLWGFCEQRSPFTEKEIHEKLKEYRLEGEWFKVTPAVREVINQIKEQ